MLVLSLKTFLYSKKKFYYTISLNKHFNVFVRFYVIFFFAKNVEMSIAEQTFFNLEIFNLFYDLGTLSKRPFMDVLVCIDHSYLGAL